MSQGEENTKSSEEQCNVVIEEDTCGDNDMENAIESTIDEENIKSLSNPPKPRDETAKRAPYNSWEEELKKTHSSAK